MEDDGHDITLAEISNFAFCALVALELARKYEKITTPLGEHLFLVQWLSMAQKQKRFPKCVAMDIALLLEQGRRKGLSSKLREKLTCLWNSCNSPMNLQTDLFRLTYVIKRIKEQGWRVFTVSSTIWGNERLFPRNPPDGFYTEDNALHNAYSDDGELIHHLDIRVVGDVNYLLTLMAQLNIDAELVERAPPFHRVKINAKII